MKKNNLIVLILCFSVLTCVSCKRNSQKQSSDIQCVEISPIQETTEYSNYENILDVDILCHLEESEFSVLGLEKKALRSSDGEFIFSDRNHQILVFDSHGHFLRKIGSRGKAPNEYSHIKDICWGDTKRELLVLDTEKFYILILKVVNI